MKTADRIAILRELPYEAKLGFVGFCLDRSLREAQRHAAARAQTEAVSVLQEGLDLLWRRAEQGTEPDPERVARLHAQGRSFKTPDPDGINLNYTVDATLVQASAALLRGMRLLQDPNVDVSMVASAVDGPVVGATTVYEDIRNARNAEFKIIDTALERLKERGNAPFSRTVFDGIPDWPRGAISRKYAAGQVTGTDINRE